MGYSGKYRGEIVYLVDAMEAARLLWVFCLRCGHASKAHPFHMSRGGKGLNTLAEAAKRCRCKHCRAKAALVVPSLDNFERR